MIINCELIENVKLRTEMKERDLSDLSSSVEWISLDTEFYDNPSGSAIFDRSSSLSSNRKKPTRWQNLTRPLNRSSTIKMQMVVLVGVHVSSLHGPVVRDSGIVNVLFVEQDKM